MQAKRGFTIIELLVALVVMAIMFAGLLPLISKSVNANKDQRLRLVAYELASQRLEEYRERKIPSLLPGTITENPAELPNATLTISVSKPKAPDQTLALVSVDVTWSFNGRNQNVLLKTYLYGSTL
jgi:prepilin-type N-terminal cleavage/methylation domain-containing protein